MKLRITGRAYINGKKKARKVSGVVSVPDTHTGIVQNEQCNMDCASWDEAINLWTDCIFEELAEGPAETVDEIFVETVRVLEGK